MTTKSSGPLIHGVLVGKNGGDPKVAAVFTTGTITTHVSAATCMITVTLDQNGQGVVVVQRVRSEPYTLNIR